MAYSPIKIANAMLDRARDEGKSLTPLQLIKLVYIAHGWNFVFQGGPLVNEPLQAWQYGPVVPSLYHAVRGYRASAIANQLGGDTDPQQLTETDRSVIRAVYERYKHLSGTQLSGLTHMDDTPWSVTWNSSGRNAVIPDELIAEHYHRRYREMTPQNG